jgi:acetyl-CoA C-acetyltransferase
MTQAFIVAAMRTAGGRRAGRLREWHPADLGGSVLDALLERTAIDPALVDDVIFGCVNQVGEQANNVARNCVLSSRLPESVPGITLDRQCGSSQQALHFAAQAVMSGSMDVVIAGGVESMTRLPIGCNVTLATSQGMGSFVGKRMSERYEGVEFSQFWGAEEVARRYGLDKDVLDRFGYDSQVKAAAAAEAGAFDDEIVALDGLDKDGEATVHRVDEGIRFGASLEAIQSLKLIQEGGRLTAGTASQICDGASAVMVVNERGLKELGLAPLARVHHMRVSGGDPVVMLDAPLRATQEALRKAGMSIDQIDLYEVNEAFASIPLAWAKFNDADPSRLNVNGGAIALGHPLGASGTRLTTTLVHALHARKKRYGLQTMCEGGGLANVTIFERL